MNLNAKLQKPVFLNIGHSFTHFASSYYVAIFITNIKSGNLRSC